MNASLKKIHRILALLASILVVVFLTVQSYSNKRIRLDGNSNNYGVESQSVLSDFLKYTCKSMTRYGANSNTDDQMYRIDGISDFWLKSFIELNNSKILIPNSFSI